MLEVIKKLDSATIKALIVATVPLLALIASFFGVDQAVFDREASIWTERLLALATAGGIAWAAWARLFKPTPPLTETAAQKTADMVAKGELRQVTGNSVQGGFIQTLMLAILLAVSVMALVSLPACTHTASAIRNADTPADFALVFLEGYDAALVTANRLKQSGALAGDDLARAQEAEKKAWPLVAKVDPLRVAYEQTRSATDAAKLQAAIDAAIREAADFVRLVKELDAKH